MRTTLNLDDQAIDAAMATAPGRTKTEIINQALREYARRRRLRGLLDLEGAFEWRGDLDELRGRAAEG